jgi:hypothetical protein
MSYFKQIASRAVLTNPGRSPSLPLLNPTQVLFRPAALVQPMELADERLGSDESVIAEQLQASTRSLATQSILSAAAISLLDSSEVPSPTYLSASPLPITPPIIDLGLPFKEQSLSDPRLDISVRPTPAQHQSDRQSNSDFGERSLSASPLPSPQVSAAASNPPDLQHDSTPPLVPIKPTKSSGADPQPAGKPLISQVHPVPVSAVYASSLTTEIAQIGRTTLEPKPSTQALPTERMTELLSQLPLPPSFPEPSKADRSPGSTIHIGAIDIQIMPAPVPPQPLRPHPVAIPASGSLSRGFASGFGLRQG